MRLKALGYFFVALCVSLSGARADNLYVIDPGSIIQRMNGATDIGPAEALSGSFIWHNQSSSTSGLQTWNATALDFQSVSYRLTLNTTENDLGTSVFSDGRSFFGEVVDTTGLGVSTPLGASSLTVGSFTGTATNPIHLSYTNVRLAPRGGGLFRGRLDFSATLVPEPTALSAILVVGVIVACRRPVHQTNLMSRSPSPCSFT